MWGDLFLEIVAAIYSFGGYMEQIVFVSSYITKASTFLEELCKAFDIILSSILISPLTLILQSSLWSKATVTERVEVSIAWVTFLEVICLFP